MLLYLLGAASGPASRSELSPELVTLLSRAYDCIPPEAPRLDLVPLLAAADWELQHAATLGHLTALLLPPADISDGGAGVADTVRLICEARRDAGLPELPVCSTAELGALPAHHDATSAAEECGGACGQPSARRFTHERVAVGGTFDRLHAGHRLLLAVAALACTRTCYVGVTGDKLLASKANAHLLDSYEHRSVAAKEFLESVRPRLRVEMSALLDPAAPPKAATMADITALVISRETATGGAKLQQMRRDHGIEEALDLVLVDLVGAPSQAADAPKLSSSALRSMDATNGGGGGAGGGAAVVAARRPV